MEERGSCNIFLIMINSRPVEQNCTLQNSGDFPTTFDCFLSRNVTFPVNSLDMALFRVPKRGPSYAPA